MTDPAAPPTAQIPADVERPDRLLFGLTARQAAILATVAVVLWLAFTATRHLIAPLVFLGAASPLIVLAVVLTLGQRDGISLDRFVLAAIRWRVGPRRFLHTSEGANPTPGWLDPSLAEHLTRATPRSDGVSPVVTVSGDGVIDLGRDGAVALLAASTVNLSLRSGAEQQALIGAFAAWAHALSGPTQILIRSHPIDLTGAVAALVDAAGALPHPALSQAAHDHAVFLADLSDRHELLARQVLIALREPTSGHTKDAGMRLRQRASEAARALASADVRTVVLDGEQVTAVLAGSAVPETTTPDRLAPPGTVITGGQQRVGP